MVKDLYRLQRELRTFKQANIRTFRDSDEGDISSDESDAEVISVEKKIKLTRNRRSTDEDEELNKTANSSIILKQKRKQSKKKDGIKLFRNVSIIQLQISIICNFCCC